MKKYNILIVDDEENVVNSLMRALASPAYTIMPAFNHEQADSIFKSHKIDLVICDYKLGNANGLDLLVRFAKEECDVIAILLTGHADLDIALEAINKATLYKFILKPWNNDDLRVTVKRALEQRDLVLENRKLVGELKKRDIVLKSMEKDNPGITDIKKDECGRIIIEDEQ